MRPAPTSTHHQPPLLLEQPRLRTVLLLATALVVAFLAARLTRPEGTQLALVAPGAAIAVLWIGTVWRRRHFRLSLVLLPSVIALATLVSGHAEASLALVFAVANLAQAVVACWLAAAWSAASDQEDEGLPALRWQLRTTADLGRLVLVAVISSIGAAALTTMGLRWLSAEETSPFTVLQLLVRNSVSVIVLVSVVLLLLDRGAAPAGLPFKTAGTGERWGMRLAVVVGYALVFWWNPALPLAYAVLPLSAWYALRRPTVDTAFHLLMVMVAVVVATVLGRGPFPGYQVATTVLLAQGFIGLVNVSTLLTALSRDERHRLLQQAELARAEAAEHAALLGSVFSSVSDGLSVYDRHGETLLRNGAADTLLGPEGKAATPSPWSEGFGFFRLDGSRFADDELPVLRALRGEDVPGVDVIVKSAAHPDGVVLNISAQPLAAGHSVPWSGGVVAAYHDVTEVRARADRLARTRDRLARQVAHDTLTGLPNRTLFHERLDQALNVEITQILGVGVLYLDLDGFKAVNDSAGHGAGDEVLREVGVLFSGCVRPQDTVARMGGDEFALVCPAPGGVEGLQAIAERILAVLKDPVVTKAGIFRIGASIGMRLAYGGECAEQLLRDADAAMYRSKRAGKNRATPYDPQVDGRTAAQSTAEIDSGAPRPTPQVSAGSETGGGKPAEQPLVEPNPI